MTLAAVLEAFRVVSGSDVSLTWVSESFLLDQKIMPWTEMPLWIPESTMQHVQGFMAIDCQKARAVGLRCRSLHETISATLRWQVARRQGSEMQAGLSADRERYLLQWWHSKKIFQN